MRSSSWIFANAVHDGTSAVPFFHTYSRSDVIVSMIDA